MTTVWKPPESSRLQCGAEQHDRTPRTRSPSLYCKERGLSPRRDKWSQRVTETSRALMLEPGVFTLRDSEAIARSLRRSAERSRRRKSAPFRSAMSMLTFYINRAGRTLTRADRVRLEAAKDELRALYGKPRQGKSIRKQ